MSLLAIDPGKVSGWAVFCGKKLLHCGLCSPDSFAQRIPFAAMRKAIIEVPQVYPRSKTPPNDLITLAVDVGRYLEKCHARGILNVELVRPATWKGQVPKEVHHARLRKVLSAEELLTVLNAEVAYPKAQRHNMLDAVALGMYAAGRRV